MKTKSTTLVALALVLTVCAMSSDALGDRPTTAVRPMDESEASASTAHIAFSSEDSRQATSFALPARASHRLTSEGSHTIIQRAVPLTVTATDMTPTAPSPSPAPSSYQPRYISGFGSGDSFTVFFEDRDNANTISYVSTITGPTGYPASATATDISPDTHFCVKDWPINIGGTDYDYRAWASVGNNLDHRFYVSNNLTNWTLVSTFTITVGVYPGSSRSPVYYGFHDVILLNGTYYAWGESNQGQTVICSSANGDDVWVTIGSVGGTLASDGPLQMPESGTPSGSFFDLGFDRGYGKIMIRGNDSGFYLAINTAAQPSLAAAALEAAFIDPNNWTWHDGTTGLPGSPFLAQTAEHDMREGWLVPGAAGATTWNVIYDADFGVGDGGKALGYATMSVPPPPPTEAWVDDDYCDVCGNDGHTWGHDAFDNIQDAVDAVEGSTVYVAAGTYNERLLIDKSVDLLGAQAGVNPVPAGTRTNPAAESVITEVGLATPNPDVLIEIPSAVTNVTIDGFTLSGDPTNATADTSTIRAWDDNLTISNNIMDGRQVVIYKGGSNLLFNRNRVTANKNGVVCQPSTATNAVISNNLFVLGSSPAGGEDAIHLSGTVDSQVTGNTATGFVNGKGVGGSGQTNLEVSGNTFDGNKDAVSFWGNTTFVSICNNTLSDSVRYGISVKGQDVDIRGNVIHDNGDHGINIDTHTLVTERVEIHCNSIVGNVGLGLNVAGSVSVAEVNAEDNWWGTNVGGAISGMVTAGVDYDPWLATGQIHLACGGNRLVDLQNNDGGWDWPLDDGNPNNASPLNTIGPIGRGLARAYQETGDAGMYAALQNVATLLQTKTTNFSPSDGYLAAELDRHLGGSTNVDHVVANYYDPLAAGTYDRNGAGTLYDTAGYITLIHDSRHGGGIGNLAAWDIGIGLVGAASAGVTGVELDTWIQGVKTEIDLLDGAGYYDVIGLAGAVYALASVAEDFDPTAGEHAAASSLSDLADILVAYQIVESGGFAWNSAYVIPYDFNETIQETSYSVLALLEMGGYSSEVASAVDYINSVQLCTGGWENYVGSASGENNEVTAEALWAAGLPVKNLDTGELFGTIQEAVDDGDTLAGHTLEIQVAVHSDGQTIIDKNLTLRGGSVDTIKMTEDTGSSGDSRGWFLVNPDVALDVSDLIFDGNGHLIWQAFRHKGNGGFTNCTFRDINYNESGPHYSGVAIAAFGSGVNPVDVTGCVFEDVGRVGVLYFGTGVSGSAFSGSTYTGKGSGDWLDYALDISAGAVITVSDSTMTQCRGVASSDGSTSAGILVTTYYGGGTAATITGCTINVNTTGIAVGYDLSDTSTVVAHDNAIYDNGVSTGISTTSSVLIDATENWWGDASGPLDISDDAGEDTEVDVGTCTGDPASEKNEDGTGDSVDDTSTEVVDYCPWLQAPVNSLVLEADDCQDDAFAGEAGTQIEVELWMRSLTGPASGFQAFLAFDSGVLAYRGDLSTYTTSPFDQHIQALLTAEIAAGQLNLDGSDSTSTGSTADSLLATLVFTVSDECASTQVSFGTPVGPFLSELSFEGVPIPTNLESTPAIDLDDTPPTIVCPADVTVNTDAGVCTASGVALGTPTTDDNCGVASVTNDASEPYVLGDTIVTWTVTDTCGNTAECQQTVTVEDNENPTITCPADVTVNTDTGVCTASGVALGTPTTDDNCSVASVTNDAIEPYALGDTTVTWTVTDGSGNTATCMQTVTVEDNENPTITCPADVTVNTDTGVCTASGVALGTPTTDDNCSVASVTNDAIEPYALGDTTVTWTVTDGSGNTATCMQTVTVEDNENPTITCPTDVTVNADAGACTATGVDLGTPTTDDNCSVASVTNDGSEPYGPGDTTVTWTVTDGYGNTATCMQTVTVDGVNEVTATVVLELVDESDWPGPGPLIRCIEFTAKNCDTDTDAAPVSVLVTFDTNTGDPDYWAMGTASFTVECGEWTHLCAKDEQHTLYDTVELSIIGTEYEAASVLVLEGGDTDNDSDVDINDVTWLLYQYGATPAADGGCAWDGTRDADFSNNDLVSGEDYVILSSNWFHWSRCECPASPMAGPAAFGVAETVLPTSELPGEVAARADLNSDGVVDYKDVEEFEALHGLPNTLSSKMAATAARLENGSTRSRAGSAERW